MQYSFYILANYRINYSRLFHEDLILLSSKAKAFILYTFYVESNNDSEIEEAIEERRTSCDNSSIKKKINQHYISYKNLKK